MTDLNVSRAVVPIVRLGPDDEEVRAILGTGFFVGSLPVVVTAGHVFRDNPLSPGEAYGFTFLPPQARKPRVARFTDYTLHDTFDVAATGAQGVTGAIPLRLARVEIASNVDVLAFEFSQGSIERRGEKLRVDLHPFTHKGNVLRHYTSRFPERVPTRVLDTSFPALQGASGAPVIRADDFAVVGMLVANHERHLLPAQVVRIENADGLVEDTKYFLPTGKALSTIVLQESLGEIGAAPEIVD